MRLPLKDHRLIKMFKSLISDDLIFNYRKKPVDNGQRCTDTCPVLKLIESKNSNLYSNRSTQLVFLYSQVAGHSQKRTFTTNSYAKELTVLGNAKLKSEMAITDFGWGNSLIPLISDDPGIHTSHDPALPL